MSWCISAENISMPHYLTFKGKYLDAHMSGTLRGARPEARGASEPQPPPIMETNDGASRCGQTMCHVRVETLHFGIVRAQWHFV